MPKRPTVLWERAERMCACTNGGKLVKDGPSRSVLAANAGTVFQQQVHRRLVAHPQRHQQCGRAVCGMSGKRAPPPLPPKYTNVGMAPEKRVALPSFLGHGPTIVDGAAEVVVSHERALNCRPVALFQHCGDPHGAPPAATATRTSVPRPGRQARWRTVPSKKAAWLVRNGTMPRTVPPPTTPLFGPAAEAAGAAIAAGRKAPAAPRGRQVLVRLPTAADNGADDTARRDGRGLPHTVTASGCCALPRTLSFSVHLSQL